MVTAVFKRNSGYPIDKEETEKLISNGTVVFDKEYILDQVNMSQSSTDITVEGIDFWFNSVCFDYYDNGKEVELHHYPEYNPYYYLDREE